MSSPVTASAPARRSLWRWSIAAVATAALVLSGSGLVVFAQSGSGESRGPAFVPADAFAYAEARLDMPAGQGEAVAQMMTAFPGFADAGAFEMKVDELFAMMAGQMGLDASAGDLIGDVLTGEIGVSMSDFEAAMMGDTPSLLLGLATADAAAAGAALDALVAGSFVQPTEETYNDVVILTDPSSEPPLSVALHGDWLLVGTGPATVQEAIDVLDGTAPSLADDADFATAWSRVPAAHLGAAWMDVAALAPMVDLATMMAAGQAGMDLPVDDLAAMLPNDMVFSLAAESDRLTLEATVTPGEQTPALAVGESELASTFPADTQVYIETRELGTTIEATLTQLADLLTSQELAAGGADVEAFGSDIELIFGEDSPFAAMLGAPLPQVLEFVSDAGVGAGLSSDGLWLGIAAEVNDPDLASERVGNLMTVLQMMTMDPEMGVTIETNDVAGVEVTSIMVPFDAMLAESGVPLSLGDSIDVALTDDTLLIGLGDFVESALSSDGSDSLGASAGYADALGEDTVNSGVLYVDIGGLVAALDPMLAMMAPEWAEIEPYASAFDRFIAVGTEDGGVQTSRMTVIVGQ